MNIQARRVFRLALTVAIATAIGYGLGLALPYLAPLFALILCASPAPPMGPKSLLGLTLLVVLILGVGLLVVPLLQYFPVAAVLIIAAGIFMANYIAMIQKKAMVGTFLTIGLTLISSTGTLDYVISYLVISSLVGAISIAVVCHWLVYPLFPEDEPLLPEQPVVEVQDGVWLSLRAMMVVTPIFLLVLINPLAYLPILLKGNALAQEASGMSARTASRELLGSTFVGGILAILFWFGLGLQVSLWMLFLWMLFFGIYISAKLYGVLQSRWPMSFWLNVGVTMLILVGSAIGDSAEGKDVYEGFAVRMGLFFCVTFYAVVAIVFFERWRERRLQGRQSELAA